MTSDIYNECVKALAYGYSAADVSLLMSWATGLPEADVRKE